MTALLRSDTVIVINPDIVRPAPLGFALQPLPPAAGVALSADGDVETPLAPGEVRLLRCHPTQGISGGGIELTRSSAQSSCIAIEAVEPGGEFPAKTILGREFTVTADVFGDGHDVLAADLLWRPADMSEWQRIPMTKLLNDRWEARVRRTDRRLLVRGRGLVGSMGNLHP